MLKFVSTISIVLVAAISQVGPALSQQATSLQTFVSGLGADTGNCDRLKPCRTFVYAVNKTAPHGQIIALDSAEYGMLPISNSMTVSAPIGVEASINVPSNGIGVFISMASKGRVELNGLTIDGNGVGVNGIEIYFGSPEGTTVNVSHCVIRNLTNAGIFQASATTTVSDTTISNMPYGIMYRPEINPTSALNVLSHSTITNTTRGVMIYEGTVSLVDDVFKDDNVADVNLQTTAGSAYIYNSFFNSISVGYPGFDSSGQVFSFGNNAIKTLVRGSITPIALK